MSIFVGLTVYICRRKIELIEQYTMAKNELKLSDFQRNKENPFMKQAIEDIENSVKNHKVFDEHLQKNRNGTLKQSDHAQVVCEIEI